MRQNGSSLIGRTLPAFSSAAGFVKRLPRDWIVSAARTSIFRFFYQMVLPYLSIYTLSLGANGADLGLVNCLGMVAAAVLSLFNGSLIDAIGPKRIYLIGIALLGLSWLVYGLASSWPVIIVAMILYYLGFRTSGHSCGTICANSLPRADRATAMSCCETLAAGLLGVVGPLLGAFIVAKSGGVTTKGIRPLFFISLAGTFFSYFLVRTKLSDRSWGRREGPRRHFLADAREALRHARHPLRLVVIATLAQLPQGMIIPFTQPYAATKGASGWVLGAMVTGFALTPLLLGIPAGRLADRIGRKKVIYLASFPFWASCLLLVLGSSPFVLVLAGVLQGTYFIASVVASAYQFELIEPEFMGRWLGILGFFQMLVAALVAYASGIIWDRLGPQYVFLIPIVLDIFVKFPILLGMPETRGESTEATAPTGE